MNSKPIRIQEPGEGASWDQLEAGNILCPNESDPGHHGGCPLCNDEVAHLFGDVEPTEEERQEAIRNNE
jgi:hypothetical protein